MDGQTPYLLIFIGTLQVEYELSSPWANPVIIGWYWELTAKITDCIFIQINCQFKNDGTAFFIVCEIPDAFTMNGINHRSDFILSAPYGIEISHSILLEVLR